MITNKPIEQFIALYQSIYKNLYSSWGDGERIPSAEAIAVLKHLHLSGPLTITEAAIHFNRAQSAMSELIDRLKNNGYTHPTSSCRVKLLKVVINPAT